jgi:hypothetical protein
VSFTLQHQGIVCTGRDITFIGPFVLVSKLLRKKLCVSSNALHLYVRVLILRISQDISCPALGVSWFPEIPHANAGILYLKRRP